jgi:outer membrane protein assembly factor BamB
MNLIARTSGCNFTGSLQERKMNSTQCEGIFVKKRVPCRSIVVLSASILLCSGTVWGQRNAGDWSMTGNDASQSGWQKIEPKLTAANAAQQFKFLWKLKLGTPAEDSFTEPLLRQRLINANGFKDLVFWGDSDDLYAVDDELGRVEWKKHFDIAPAQTAAGCSRTSMAFFVEPPQVINFNAHLTPGAVRPPQPPPVPQGERKLGMKAGGGGFGIKGIYALTSDGFLHEQILADGHDYAPSVKFLPAANGHANGLSMQGDTIYTTTAHGCGGVPNGAWSLTITPSDYTVGNYSTQKSQPLNLTGLAVSPDGIAFLATGNGPAGENLHPNSVVALDPGNGMKVKDWYSPLGKQQNIEHVSPMTILYKSKQLVVAPGPNGTFVLLDASSLGGADHHTSLSETVQFAKPGHAHPWDGFSTYVDKDGTTWVLATVSGPVVASGNVARNGETPHGALIAFKIEDTDGKPTLTPAWISADVVNPAPAAIANDVVVLLSGGNSQTHATLYVLDAATGKALYSSKNEITTYSRFSGVSFGDSHAYFTDHDGTMYAFGIGMEH